MRGYTASTIRNWSSAGRVVGAPEPVAVAEPGVMHDEYEGMPRCPKHPDVVLFERGPQRLPVGVDPTSLCRKCRADKLQKRRRTGSETEETLTLSPPHTTPRSAYSERATEAVEAYDARQKARGMVKSGSPEERAAVEQSDYLREKELEAEQRKSRHPGRYVFSTHSYADGETDWFEVVERVGGRKHKRLVHVP
jgi:hypothetical protein